MRLLLTSLILILVATNWCYCDLFSALMDVHKTFDQRQELAYAIDDYIVRETMRLKKLQEFSDQLKVTASSVENSTDVSHPIHAYLLIKKLSNKWKGLVKVASANSIEQFESKLSSLQLPDEEDVHGAMEAIIRLQDTYALPASSLATGSLKATEQNPTYILNADECFAIGYHAYSNSDFYHARSWFLESLELMGNDTETQDGLQRSLVLDYLAYVEYKQGHVAQALSLTQELLQLDAGHARAQQNAGHFRRLLRERRSAASGRRGDDGAGAETEEAMRHNHPHRDGWYGSAEFNRYQRLCRGDAVPPTTTVDVDKRRLVCRLRAPHPFFLLAPLQEEVASWRPFVALWHRAIADAEIRDIQRLAGPLLRRATVQEPGTGRLVTARYRVSKSAWLRPELHPLVARLDQRIQLATGLSVQSAEELQVANYGLGGHYEPHYDFALRRDPNAFERRQGNRVATVMFYLTDVAAGGATVFTDLGLQLWPTRGTAAFWYNLKASGEGEMATRHAACPVLHGDKWVMNKWLHERDQEFRRPCGLSPLL